MTSLPNTIADHSQADFMHSRAPRRILATKLQYLLTYGTSAAIMISGLFAYRLASQQFSELAFAQYTLMRRSISFLVPFLMLGLAVGIAKCVAQSISASESSNSSVRFLAAGTLMAFTSTGAWMSISKLCPAELSYICTGSSAHSLLVQSLSIMLLGLLLCSCTTAYLRGRMHVSLANLVKFCSLGAVPLAVVAGTDKPTTFFSVCGFVIVGINLFAIATIFWINRRRVRLPRLPVFRKLISISVPRVPGDIAFYGLLVVPATLASHRYGTLTGGEVAYALSLLALAQQIVVAPSHLLLPEAASLLSSGERSRVTSRVKKLLHATTLCTILLVVVGELFAESLVRLHLGTSNSSVTHAVRLLLPAAIPLNMAICVRGVLDAANDKPIMPRICVVSLICFVLLAMVPWPTGWKATPILVTFDVSILLMACLALLATGKALNDSTPAATVRLATLTQTK